ncbi:MAG: class I SAM-dependent methyltransferase [Chloroflexota bacterium]
MKNQTNNPWLLTRARTGAEYDAPYFERAKAGIDIHGEANLVDTLLQNESHQPNNTAILDAGCGTGRIAIELARRGYQVVGVDLDEVMLHQARSKAPQLAWHLDDLHTITLTQQFEAIVMAGNVMIYLTPNTEEAVVANMTRHLKPGGLLISAFELNAPSWSSLTLNHYEQMADSNRLAQFARWSTWDQDAWQEGDGYVVSVYRK